MKKILTSLAILATSATLCMAQKTPVEKYELVPDGYMDVYLDLVSRHSSRVINSETGDYIGQTTPNGSLYGYGMFLSCGGQKVTGMFRDGHLLFGITMGGQNTIVGSPDFYISYSNTTGKPEYIMRGNNRLLLTDNSQYDYGFVTMRYQNGDSYTGEIYQRKRHGYGIYYYANGDIWFGPYDNDQRNGYGVLFSEEDGMILGIWRGEQVSRVTMVKHK